MQAQNRILRTKIAMANSPAELDLIERFITSYNAIDNHLQNILNNGHSSSFRSLVDLYAKRHRGWKDAELLRTCGGLRNLLVHEKVEPYEYPCVPIEKLVLGLEAARDRLLHPQRVIPRFERKVVTIKAKDSLAHVLKLIHELKITHFPVYEDSASKSHFAGVLTENGITRWLAEHTANGMSLVDLAEEPVAEVLAREEGFFAKRHNYEFAPRDARAEELVQRFHDNTYLEAVLITSKGEPYEKLLGIVTRWDVLNFDL